MNTLTKTDFIHYLRCPESLWLSKNKPEKAKQDEYSLFLRKIIAEGYEVESYAEQLFPEAIKLPDNGSFEETREALGESNSQFIQATFGTTKGALARVDILERLPNNAWHLYEVKSSTSVSTKKSHNHIFDTAFQKYVLEQNGLQVGKVSVIHLNKEYLREGEVQASQLLEISEVTSQVNAVYETIMEQIQEALDFINLPEIEEDKCSCLRKTRSNHCDNFDYFNAWLPKHPVHEIKRITESKLNGFLDANQYGISEIQEDASLNESQSAQVISLRQGKPMVDWNSIKDQLDALVFPLHFIDYETFASAVPQMDGLRPHEHIPFQVSIHSMDENGDLKHFEHLADDLEMPEKMLKGMQEFTGTAGTFVSWHASFEKGRNNTMKLWLPQFNDYLDYINNHMFDLETVFAKDYIDYRFKGSSSIKKVLPVLVPDLDYGDLEVQDGTMAMDTWGKLVSGATPSSDVQEIRKSLLAYCELDTLAMVEIYKFLKKQLEK
ncbi:DUF2779 domain-containing protein [Flagellimonas sp.]|uniref:DUF2779 domain-containing protein n=1 Tax=Flagellimonas sp. TaxID=2058762 RepID=UPI003BB21E2E